MDSCLDIGSVAIVYRLDGLSEVSIEKRKFKIGIKKNAELVFPLFASRTLWQYSGSISVIVSHSHSILQFPVRDLSRFNLSARV